MGLAYRDTRLALHPAFARDLAPHSAEHLVHDNGEVGCPDLASFLNGGPLIGQSRFPAPAAFGRAPA